MMNEKPYGSRVSTLIVKFCNKILIKGLKFFVKCAIIKEWLRDTVSK